MPPRTDMRVLRVDSYFSIETELAAAFRDWPEYVRGEGYSVELASRDESIVVRMVEAVDVPEDLDSQHVLIEGTGVGRLFDAVAGRVMYEMAAHSDNLQVMRWHDL